MLIHEKSDVPFSDEELVGLGDLLFTNKLLLAEISNLPRNNDGVIISEYEAHTLRMIEEHPNITSVELAEKLRRNKSTVSPLVYKLCTAGYITKNVDPNNRRRHFLNITEKGAELCAAHRELDAEIMRKTILQLLDQCTIDEFRSFIKVVRLRNAMFAEQLDGKDKNASGTYFGC